MDNVRTPSDQSLSSSNSMESDLSSLLLDMQIGDMVVDGYQNYNQQENEVVNISPDADENENGEQEGEARVRADDCT